MLKAARVPACVGIVAFSMWNQFKINAICYAYIIQPWFAFVVVLNADQLHTEFVAVEIERSINILANETGMTNAHIAVAAVFVWRFIALHLWRFRHVFLQFDAVAVRVEQPQVLVLAFLYLRFRRREVALLVNFL